MEELYNLSWLVGTDENDASNIEIMRNIKKGESFKLIGNKDCENAWRYGCSWLIKWIPRIGEKIDDLPSSVKESVMNNTGVKYDY